MRTDLGSAPPADRTEWDGVSVKAPSDYLMVGQWNQVVARVATLLANIPNAPAEVSAAPAPTGTPGAGKYVDGGTGAWTALPTGGATTLGSLTDVASTPPADAEVLTYDETAGQWQPEPLITNPAIDATQITSGLLDLARAPAGSMINYDKVKGGFGTAAGSLPPSRPSNRVDITFVWTSDTDPAAVAIAGDKWDRY